MITQIQKRDGSLAPYNEAKINLVIDYACDALDVDSNKLKENLTGFLYEQIPTDKIQNLLIQKALTLISLYEPDWKIVAGRLVLLDLYKNSKKTNGHDNFGYPDYTKFVHKATELGLYSSDIIDSYTDAELDHFSKVIDPKFDLTYDYGRLVSYQKRYLVKQDKDIFELPQHAIASIALMDAMRLPKSTRLKKAAEYYYAIANRELSPATPFSLNLRVPDGNLASCFILEMDDNIESIFKTIDDIAQISKNGGGVGCNVTRVRGLKSWIRGVSGVSGGVCPWIKIINDVAVGVNQQGKRAGAVTVGLAIWHLDILDFLDLQTENGDQRNKAYDVLLQAVVNDVWIKKYKEDKNQDWYLFDPYEVNKKLNIDLPSLYGKEFEKAYEYCIEQANAGVLTLFKVVKCREIMKRLLIPAMEVGTPYWFNMDTVNRKNANKHIGYISQANLCVESFTSFGASKNFNKIIDDGKQITQIDLGLTHVCNLISVVLPQIGDDDHLRRVVRTGVEMLDNLIDVGTPPIAEAQKHNDEMRVLGLGIMGYHEYITSRGIKYSESADFADQLLEKISYWALEKSCELARDRGQYKYFPGSDWSKSIYFGNHVDTIPNRGLDWKALDEKIQKYGLRNADLLAIAPNTSTSVFIGCSASFLPVYDLFFHDNNSMGSFPILPANIKDPNVFWLYETFKNIDQHHVIDVASSMQKWIGQGISMELMLNLDIIESIEDVRDLYLYAMEKDCKTIYYLRTKKKSADTDCAVCAN